MLMCVIESTGNQLGSKNFDLTDPLKWREGDRVPLLNSEGKEVIVRLVSNPWQESATPPGATVPEPVAFAYGIPWADSDTVFRG